MFRPTLTLTMHNASTVLDTGMRAVTAGQTEMDLAQLTVVDSAAVATLLAWQRAAAGQGRTLTFTHVPPSLKSLIDLYDLRSLLPG